MVHTVTQSVVHTVSGGFRMENVGDVSLPPVLPRLVYLITEKEFVSKIDLKKFYSIKKIFTSNSHQNCIPEPPKRSSLSIYIENTSMQTFNSPRTKISKSATAQVVNNGKKCEPIMRALSVSSRMPYNLETVCSLTI